VQLGEALEEITGCGLGLLQFAGMNEVDRSI
jgi:hypothetical protein